jgi:hypothetical protein
MDNYDLESQGINPLDLDQVKAAKIKLSSDYFNTKLVEPDEQATSPMFGAQAAMGFVPFPYQFDTAGLKKFLVDTGNATLENIAQLTKSGVDFLFGEPGEIGNIGNKIQEWAMSKVGKDLSDEEKASIGETVLKFGGKSLATVDQIFDLLDELPDYESVKGFTDNFIKNLSQDTAMQEQVANFIDTQDEKKIQQLGGAIIAGELTPRLFRGAVKGAQVLKPKVLEFVEEGIDAFEDFFGMKKFAVPKDKKGVAPRKKPNASFTGTLSEFDETAAETKPGFVKDRSVKGNIYRTNLITNDLDNPNPLLRNLWKWVTPVNDYKNARQIISIEGRVKGKSENHFFTLQANFPTGAKLANYVRKEPPNLRPTTQGELQFGKQVGSVRIGQQKNAKIHPVYDEITLTNNVPIKEIKADERPIIPAPKKLFRNKETKESQSFMGLNQFEREFDTGEYIDPVDKKIITNQFIQNGTVKIKKDVDVFDQPNNQPPKTEAPESVAPTTNQVETLIDENKIGSRIGKKVNRELNSNSNVNFDELIQNEQKLKQNLNLFKYSPSLKLKGTAKQKARQIVDYFKDNLRWIYNTMPKDAVVESKKWYGGANAISKRFAEQYDFTHRQVSAIIAALSPKAEWSNNVTLAERSLDILTNKKDFKLDSQADETIKRLYDPKSDKGKIYYKITHGVSAKKYLDNKKIAAAKRKIFDEISVQLKGLSYNDIDNLTFNNLSLEESNKRKNLLKVLWVRVYDEAYNDSLVPAVKPDGTIGKPIKNKDGSNKKRAWQSYDAIRKVISIYEDGSLENINIQVGNNHKVRSFYNNIVNHLDNDSITIDTHAMAAAHLRPLAQIDLEVTNGFGGMPSNDDYAMLAKNGFVPKKKPMKPATNDTTGDNGTYGFYHQAYKELAEELGIRGNQAQSVIWDGIKRLYDDNYKTLENKKIIFKLWKQWQSGKISIDEVRETILKETNGYKDLAFELTD